MRSMFVAALGSAALAVAGCGDDGDSGSPSGDGNALTKAQYIAQADKICAEVDKATQTYSDQIDALPKGSGPERIATILEGGLAETRKGVARLKALDAPSEDKATIDAYFTSIDKSITAYEGLQQAVQDKDETRRGESPRRPTRCSTSSDGSPSAMASSSAGRSDAQLTLAGDTTRSTSTSPSRRSTLCGSTSPAPRRWTDSAPQATP